MKSANYFATFILAAADCPAAAGLKPQKPGAIAREQFLLLRESPSFWTSDDLLFEVHARRAGVVPVERMAARAAFFVKPKACLRAPPLVKSFGWGLHHDDKGRVAAYVVESEDYRRLAALPSLKIAPGMRNRRV